MVFKELKNLDVAQAAALFRKAFANDPWNDDWSNESMLHEYIKEVSGGYNALNYGLFIDERLVAVAMGSIHHWWEGANYNIEELCVDPDVQGQGIGTRFIELIEDDIKKRDVAGIFLQTDNDKPSYKFYMKNGFSDLTTHVSLFKKCE